MGNNTESMAAYAEKWIDSFLDKEYKGAQFLWSREKADSFATTSLKELLFDEYFLNAGKWLRPGIIDTLFELYEEKKKRHIELVAVLGSFGTGKTTGIGSILTWLNWFEFTCKYKKDSNLVCPQEYYDLEPSSKVAFIALSKTREKSKDITFSKMVPRFYSQFNKDYFPVNDRMKREVEIVGNNTYIFPHTATEAALAGYDVYCYVMDEISFLDLTDNSSRSKGKAVDTYDQAQEAHNSAEGRRFSRFGRDGMGILLSSVNYDEDYLMTIIRNCYNHISPENIYYKILLPWEVNPEEYSKTKYFYFDTTNYKIIEDSSEVCLLDREYVERPIDDVIFGDPVSDPNDQLLASYRGITL